MTRLAMATVFLLMSAPIAIAESPIMPLQLVEYAQERACEQIDDFFDRPGPVGPPYVYFSSAAAPDDEGAVLWCRKSVQDRTQYLLLIKGADKQRFGMCSDQIQYWNYPGGLNLETRTNIRLSDFRFVTAPEMSGPSTVVTDDVISASYDGVFADFVCHQGSWLYQILH